MLARMILLAMLVSAGADIQARVVPPETLEKLVQASDVIIVGEIERGLFWSPGLACAVLVLLLWRRRKLLLTALVCCASCRGGGGAGEHYSIDVKRVLRGTCPEPAIELMVPGAGPRYEPDLRAGTEYVMFLRRSGDRYTTSWTAHALLPVENGRVQVTWLSGQGKKLTVEDLAKALARG